MVETTWEQAFGKLTHILPVSVTRWGLAHEYEEQSTGIDESIVYYELDNPFVIQNERMVGFGVCQRGSKWKAWAFKYNDGRFNTLSESQLTDRYGIILDSSDPDSEEEVVERAVELLEERALGETE